MKLNCKVLTCRFVLTHKLSVFFLFQPMKMIRFIPTQIMLRFDGCLTSWFSILYTRNDWRSENYFLGPEQD